MCECLVRDALLVAAAHVERVDATQVREGVVRDARLVTARHIKIFYTS